MLYPFPMQTIRTDRLELVPATAELVHAEIENHASFFALLDVAPVGDWPSENLRDALPIFLDVLTADPANVGWCTWYWIDRSERLLVGGGGFKGQPSDDGDVEIGYETRPALQRRGYAQEAVGALVDWALGQPGVRRVIAETQATNVPSVGLLSRLAFEEAGRGSEPTLLRFQRALAGP